jgi:glycosyltransferase involved in cell wall biosynthesis
VAPSRIAIVTSHFPPSVGGLERHVFKLAEAMAKRGVEVDVIVPGALTARETGPYPGVLIRRFANIGGTARYSLSPGLWNYLRGAGRTYDLIHAHNYHALPILAAACSRAPRLVISPHYHGAGHSLSGKLLNAPHRRMAARRIFDRADAVLCVSNAEAALLAEHFPGAVAKITVIHNGLDFEALHHAQPLPDRGRVILTASRLEQYKRIHMVLDAVRLLPPDWRLCVIGRGRERSRLERRAHALGLSARVSFLDPVSDELFRRWLRTAEVYVSMSLHEAFGLAVAEAITAGAGVVMSDIGSHREVASLLDPPRCELISTRADPQALARAILGMGRQPAEIQRAELLSWERFAEGIAEVYESVIGGRCRTSGPVPAGAPDRASSTPVGDHSRR